MNFKVCVNRNNDIPVLKIYGEIRKENLNKITAKMDSFRKNKVKKIIVDLSETEFIDSYGLGAFVYIWHQYEEESIEMIFMNPHGFIKELLADSSLTKIFKIIESEDEI